MVEIGIDTSPIQWVKSYPPPSVVVYLTKKIPYSLGVSFLVAIGFWFFLKSVLVAGVVGAFILLVANVFLSFIAGAAHGTCTEFEINAQGIRIDKKSTPYTLLNKEACLNILKSQQLAYNDWVKTELLKEHQKIVLGNITLLFQDQVTRQKVVRLLIHFLSS